MGAFALAGIITAPQNDLKDMSQFGTVWLHLHQYKKVGVKKMLQIPFLYCMVYHQAYLKCN